LPEDIGNGVGRRLVAITDLKPGTGSERIAETMTTVLTAEIGSHEGLKALSRNELKAIIAHQADAAMLGCESVNCMADIAKLADAELVVSGSVERIEDAYVLSLTLVDPSGPRVLERQQATWRSSPDEMIAVVRPTVQRLLAGPRTASLMGKLEIIAPADAKLVIDGKDVGKSPLPAPIADLSTGVHRLDVLKDGFEPWHKDVAVGSNETTLARAELIDVPFYSQWWFWTATGGTVLAAGGVTAGLIGYGILDAVNHEAPHIIVGGSSK
jgi:hypothetical protein